MNAILPIFPLQIVVFPVENLNLHIFEPRYKQLIQDIQKNDTTFGVPPVINGTQREVGTEVRLIKIAHTYEDGRMDIKCKGLGPYRAVNTFSEFDNKLYAGSEIKRLDFDLEGNQLNNQRILQMLQMLYREQKIRKKLPKITVQGLSFMIGHQIGLKLEQEYELLNMPSENDRQVYIMEHLRVFIPNAIELIELRKRALLNGQFRKLGNSPEK
jgi:Lon protease-like protein